MLQSIFSAKWANFSIGTGPKTQRINLYMQVQQQNSDLQFYRNSTYCSLNSYADISNSFIIFCKATSSCMQMRELWWIKRHKELTASICIWILAFEITAFYVFAQG